MSVQTEQQHIRLEELTLYAQGTLGHATEIEPHLAGCEVCRETLSRCIGLPLNLHSAREKKSTHDPKRSEPRFATSDSATVQTLNPLSFDRLPVEVIDVSKNGVGIRSATPFYPGTVVQIRVRKEVQTGEVRHCTPQGDHAYRIGMRLNFRV